MLILTQRELLQGPQSYPPLPILYPLTYPIPYLAPIPFLSYPLSCPYPLTYPIPYLAPIPLPILSPILPYVRYRRIVRRSL